MPLDLIILSLFSIQIIANLLIAIWITSEICVLKHKIEDNKRDIDNLASLMRRNYANFQGCLTRFISETSTRFRNLNVDSNFTYPPGD